MYIHVEYDDFGEYEEDLDDPPEALIRKKFETPAGAYRPLISAGSFNPEGV